MVCSTPWIRGMWHSTLAYLSLIVWSLVIALVLASERFITVQQYYNLHRGLGVMYYIVKLFISLYFVLDDMLFYSRVPTRVGRLVCVLCCGSLRRRHWDLRIISYCNGILGHHFCNRIRERAKDVLRKKKTTSDWGMSVKWVFLQRSYGL